MTPEQEQAIRARHVIYVMDPSIVRTADDPAWCAAIGDGPWPCDTDQMRAALDEARAQRDAWSDRDEWHRKAVDRGLDLDSAYAVAERDAALAALDEERQRADLLAAVVNTAANTLLTPETVRVLAEMRAEGRL